MTVLNCRDEEFPLNRAFPIDNQDFVVSFRLNMTGPLDGRYNDARIFYYDRFLTNGHHQYHLVGPNLIGKLGPYHYRLQLELEVKRAGMATPIFSESEIVQPPVDLRYNQWYDVAVVKVDRKVALIVDGHLWQMFHIDRHKLPTPVFFDGGLVIGRFNGFIGELNVAQPNRRIKSSLRDVPLAVGLSPSNNLATCKACSYGYDRPSRRHQGRVDCPACSHGNLAGGSLKQLSQSGNVKFTGGLVEFDEQQPATVAAPGTQQPQPAAQFNDATEPDFESVQQMMEMEEPTKTIAIPGTTQQPVTPEPAISPVTVPNQQAKKPKPVVSHPEPEPKMTAPTGKIPVAENSASGDDLLEDLMRDNQIQSDLEDVDVDLNYRFGSLLEPDDENKQFAFEDPFKKTDTSQWGYYFKVALVTLLVLVIIYLFYRLLTGLFSGGGGGGRGTASTAGRGTSVRGRSGYRR